MRMADEHSLSLPLRIVTKFALNIALVWVLATYVSASFVMTGGLGASVVIGSLLTLMNIIVRPILHIITLPLKLFATVIALILVQAVFVQLIMMIVQRMDPAVVTLQIQGGLAGWALIAIIFGLANWAMKVALK